MREREAYFQLVDQGMAFADAANAVGINLRTGKRWRNGRNRSGTSKGASPHNAATPLAEDTPQPRGRYLNEAERIHLADRLRENATIRAIASELDRSPSTISREIQRNRTVLGNGRWYYRPHAADRRAKQRRPRPKSGKLAQNIELRDHVQHHLTLRWSPEQISGMLQVQFPDRPEMRVAHETIYQALYNRKHGGLHRELTRSLRTGRSLRRPRRLAHRRVSLPIKNMTSIKERPREADSRLVPGHWEGDLIVGTNSRSAIATLVERTTRFTMLVHLPSGHSAAATRNALADAINTLPASLKRSLAWDQGSEMAAHLSLTKTTGIPVYFCSPASPWQRGSNENTNGLLRQYFPKGTNLALHTPQHLAEVATELNNRPRKTLGWTTPAERFTKLLAEHQPRVATTP